MAGVNIFSPGGQASTAPVYPWSKPVTPTPVVSRPGGGGQSPLSALIASLSGAAGNLDNNQAARQEAIGVTQETRDAYDKEAAFADAQGLMAAQLQQAMQSSMGTLNRAAGGAGASQSSMMALLAQQAAQDAAQGAAELGANQAVQYGQINNQSSGVLEQLTRTDPAEINALIAALGMQQDIRSQQQRDRLARDQMDAQEDADRRAREQNRNTRPNAQIGAGAPRGPTTVMGAVAAGGSSGGSAPSTSSFFNRPGGILAGAGGGMTSYGPVAGADQALLGTMQRGTLPSQQAGGTPLPSDLFTTGLKF